MRAVLATMMRGPFHGLLRALAVLIVAGIATTVTTCDQTGGNPGPPGGNPTSCLFPARAADAASRVLHRAQQAVHCVAGYTVSVSGHNLVLPEWGGVDGGTVAIGTAGPEVVASLTRTGDGVYSMTYVDGQTFFQRSTCDHVARRSGGGGDVLRPFLWSLTQALDAGSTATLVGGAPSNAVAVAVTLPDLGPVTIVVDDATGRPLELTKSRYPNSGAQTTWKFTGWGAAPRAVFTPTGAPDQGPGGDPC